ncbi:tubulin-like doman-containing protein [candidate division NPL-UPA2 bacterium]|nr:tubulin-like doman-containing protein [candidate division NPL-UPA2 bacterium]
MRSTLILGLGGTGGFVTKLVKKLFVEEYGEKLPPHVLFTHIDTKADVEQEEHELPPLPEVEKIICAVDETKFGVVQTDDYLTRNPEMKEWLARPLPVEDMIGGAWQIRQCGRIAFFEHRRKDANIQKKLINKVSYLTGDEVSNRALTDGIELEPRALDVFLINSLAGGTGSGMFFDIAGVIKNKKPETTITLIALLPRLFEENIDAAQSVHLLYANTYACLKEINFYMSNPWEVTYDRKARDDVRVPPKAGAQGRLFDYIYLVDNVNKAGKNLIDRLHIAPLVADFIYNSVRAAGERIRDERKTMQQHITPEQWCSSFGVSILSFPLEEVLAICENLFLQKVVEGARFGGHQSFDDIREQLTDKNKGLITNNNDFDYSNWMSRLCRRKGYHPRKAGSVMAGGKLKVYSNLMSVKETLEEELASDKLAITENFHKVAGKVRGDLRRVVEEALFQKGVKYAENLLIELKRKLGGIERQLEARQAQLAGEDAEIAKLDKLIGPALEDIKEITARRFSFGWYKRCKPNVDRVIRNLKDKTEKELEVEKISYAIKLVEEIVEEEVGMIASELRQIDNLNRKLNILIARFDSGQKKGYNALGFVASNETKLIQTQEQVLTFYNKYFLEEEKAVTDTIKADLVNWAKKTIDDIEKGCRGYAQKLVADKEIEKLTIKDVQLSKTGLNKKMEQSLQDAKPFWNNATSRPQAMDFVLTGFTKDELQQHYLSLRDAKGFIKTVNEGDSEQVAAKKKRRMVFLSLEYRVPIADLSAYGLQDYAEDYKELNPREHPWVHLTRAAVGFEELIGGFSTGLEEESLLQTCRDLGIVFQRGAWYSYRELVKEKGKETLREEKIAQGYQNTIEAMEKDPTLCKELAEKVCDKLDQMPENDRRRYVRNHDPATYSEQAEFSKEHQSQYKDEGSKKPIPSHAIPNYILEKIKIKGKK